MQEDKFLIDLGDIYKEGRDIVITKQGVLHVIASIYDPIGIIALVVVSFKIFFQKIVQLKSGWNVVLPRSFNWNGSSF